MVKADQIPEHVWHTAMSTYHKTIKKRPGTAWQEAIAAALNAWPNAKTLRNDGRRQTYIVPAIILPLPQQARDE